MILFIIYIMPIDDEKTFTVQIIGAAPPFRGVTAYIMSFRPGENYGIDQTDIDRFIRWGCNCVRIPCTWAGLDGSDYSNGLEPDEFVVGNPDTGEGYSSLSAGRLHSVVDLIEQNGLSVWLGFQPIKRNPYNDPYDWVQKYGNSFIVYNEQPTYPGYPQTPLPGRERYMNFLRWICNEFPNVHIDPWLFPYHMQGNLLPNPSIEYNFYHVTQPDLMQAIRQADIDAGRPPRQIMLHPLIQGLWTNEDGKRRITGGLYPGLQPFYPDDPDVFYGFNTHDGDIGNCGGIARVNDRWDYDYDVLNDNWNGAVLFKQNHPTAKLMCQEWIGLVVHPTDICPTCGERPINQSRVDWVKAMWDKGISLGSSWTYWAYLHQPLPGGGPQMPENPLQTDGTENEIAQIISDYNLMFEK